MLGFSQITWISFLTTIIMRPHSTRGPSTVIFEPVYKSDFSASDIVNMRKTLQLTQHDLAAAFGINQVTLQRIEAGVAHDKNTLKLLQIYFNFPEAALWQLQQTSACIHSSVLFRLKAYFRKQK